jgi:hypothetical protein
VHTSVPVVSSVAGWAVKEAITWLCAYTGSVLRCGDRLRELLALLGDPRMLRTAEALDLLTDLPDFQEWRGDYDQLCDLLEEAQYMVLTSLRAPPLQQPDAGAATQVASTATPSKRTWQRWLCCAAAPPLSQPPSQPHATVVAHVRTASTAPELCKQLSAFTDMSRFQQLHAALQDHKQRIQRQASRSHVRGDHSGIPTLLPLELQPSAAQTAPPVRVHQHEHDLIPRLVARLRREPPEVRTVAICGMPGLGKTTIARTVFEELKQD